MEQRTPSPSKTWFFTDQATLKNHGTRLRTIRLSPQNLPNSPFLCILQSMSHFSTKYRGIMAIPSSNERKRGYWGEQDFGNPE